ncbi:hypothetical protein C8R45DRAFT_1045937 [Mycena sanguinolenta]|nr:hypothetical protein C8R45DRAFT_1045937 [Mycena sanguinolenta]
MHFSQVISPSSLPQVAVSQFQVRKYSSASNFSWVTTSSSIKASNSQSRLQCDHTARIRGAEESMALSTSGSLILPHPVAAYFLVLPHPLESAPTVLGTLATNRLPYSECTSHPSSQSALAFAVRPLRTPPSPCTVARLFPSAPLSMLELPAYNAHIISSGLS